MEKQLNKSNTESKLVGLQMHKGKTKFMTNFESEENIKIENHQIQWTITNTLAKHWK